jgi:hypothetical protein
MSARAEVLALSTMGCATKRSARSCDMAAVCRPRITVVDVAWSLFLAIRRATITIQVVAVIAVFSGLKDAVATYAGALLGIELTHPIRV